MSKCLAFILVLSLASVWRVLGVLQCSEETADLGSSYVLVPSVSPSDSGHLLITASEDEARNTAVCHATCINYIFEGQGSSNGSNRTARSTVTTDSEGLNVSSGDSTAPVEVCANSICLLCSNYTLYSYPIILLSQLGFGTGCFSAQLQTVQTGQFQRS